MPFNFPPRTVLVPYDLDHPSDEALAAAAALAPAVAAITVLHVVEPAPAQATLADTRNAEAKRDLDRTLATLRAALAEAGLEQAHVRVAFGSPGPTIVESIERDRPDLIVMPTHARRGLQRLVLGSVTEYVVRHARCPALELPPDTDAS
jgi:nucleotide-binding universal stress UspA family protein